MHIDIKNKQYRLAKSRIAGNIDYMTPGNLFYFSDVVVCLDTIIISEWTEEEFMQFIYIAKTFEQSRINYRNYNFFKDCIDDLEKNINKYLNEIIIKSIIE